MGGVDGEVDVPKNAGREVSGAHVMNDIMLDRSCDLV